MSEQSGWVEASASCGGEKVRGVAGALVAFCGGQEDGEGKPVVLGVGGDFAAVLVGCPADGFHPVAVVCPVFLGGYQIAVFVA